MPANSWFQWFDQVTAEGERSPVGKAMTANNYTVSHTGGGCLCWERIIDDSHYLWICDEGNGLGESTDEPFLVGVYDSEGAFDNDTMPNIAAAIAWCNERAADPDRYIAAYQKAEDARFADRNALWIARQHVATLRQWFTQTEWVTMCARNAAPDRREGVCHSHDFCDANDSMAAAFKRVMGRDIDGDSETDCKLWNAAWNLADPVLSGKKEEV